jgi:hypothetical protein
MVQLAETVHIGLMTGALAEDLNARRQLLQQQEHALQRLVAVAITAQQFQQQSRSFLQPEQTQLNDQLLQATQAVLAITTRAASSVDNCLPGLFACAEGVREHARLLMLGARVFSSAASESQNLCELGDAARAARVPIYEAARHRASRDIGLRGSREGAVRADVSGAAAARAGAPALPTAVPVPTTGPTWEAALQPPPPPPLVRKLTVAEYQVARRSISVSARRASWGNSPPPPPPPPPPLST